MPKKGRPKGLFNAIGLPKKKSEKLIPYVSLPVIARKKYLLKCITNDESIIEEVINHLRDNLHPKLTAQCVQLTSIKGCLENEAWKELLRFSKRKQKLTL